MKDKRIELRVSGDELDQIKTKAKQCGYANMSSYIIDKAIYGFIFNVDTSDVKEATRLIRNVANNVNQYARKANETGLTCQGDIEHMKSMIDEILEYLRSIYDVYKRLKKGVLSGSNKTNRNP